MLGNSWVDAQLAGSQKELGSMKSVVPHWVYTYIVALACKEKAKGKSFKHLLIAHHNNSPVSYLLLPPPPLFVIPSENRATTEFNKCRGGSRRKSRREVYMDIASTHYTLGSSVVKTHAVLVRSSGASVVLSVCTGSNGNLITRCFASLNFLFNFFNPQISIEIVHRTYLRNFHNIIFFTLLFLIIYEYLQTRIVP
jgi:hypothetical protein